MSNPRRRALVVIDAQNEYFSGNLPIEHPPGAQSIRHIARAMDFATASSIPVAVVQHTAPSGAPVFDKGTPTWDLHPEIANRPRDHLFEKLFPSAFASTRFREWLTERGIDTLVVAGYMTHNCVAATAFDAMHAGMQVEVLADATGALPYANSAGTVSAEEVQRVFRVVLHSNFAAVVDTEGWIRCIEEGTSPERSNILASNLAAKTGT